MNQNASITLHSHARNWRELAASIQDALFDAQHGLAGLNGAEPKVCVLLSRKLLSLEGPLNATAFQGLCSALRQQGVEHNFHCAAPGAIEPAAHLVQISLDY